MSQPFQPCLSDFASNPSCLSDRLVTLSCPSWSSASSAQPPVVPLQVSLCSMMVWWVPQLRHCSFSLLLPTWNNVLTLPEYFSLNPQGQTSDIQARDAVGHRQHHISPTLRVQGQTGWLFKIIYLAKKQNLLHIHHTPEYNWLLRICKHNRSEKTRWTDL